MNFDPVRDDSLYRFLPAKSSKRLAEATRSFHKGVASSVLIASVVFALGLASKFGISGALSWSVFAGEVGLFFSGFVNASVVGEPLWVRLAGLFLNFYVYTLPLPLIWYEVRGRIRMRELLKQEAGGSPANECRRPSKAR